MNLRCAAKSFGSVTAFDRYRVGTSTGLEVPLRPIFVFHNVIEIVYTAYYAMSVTAPTASYSFRAPRDLGVRLEHARGTLRALLGRETSNEQQFMREFERAFLREPEALTEARTQSELIRAVIELVLVATEKVERDQGYGEAYAAMARERVAEDREFVDDVALLASENWRED